jgi:hypothetical protein
MKFGVREICDVVFKAKTDVKIGKSDFVAGQPVLYIDTAKTSTLEGAATTVYAQGGKGNTRLIAWEGEKTLTFTVEDALLSPIGFSILSGAGLVEAADDNLVHMHMTTDVILNADKKAVLTLDAFDADHHFEDGKVAVCKTDEAVKAFGTVLDGSGAGIAFLGAATVSGQDLASVEGALVVDSTNKVEFLFDKGVAGQTVRIDYYIIKKAGVQTINIDAENFAGYYYVEASTLFRREDTGKDMPAELILPNVKIQSNFTFTMASTGDPSTFTFTMDAFPGYTMFDKTKKVLCAIQMVGTDAVAGADKVHSVHDAEVAEG